MANLAQTRTGSPGLFRRLLAAATTLLLVAVLLPVLPPSTALAQEADPHVESVRVRQGTGFNMDEDTALRVIWSPPASDPMRLTTGYKVRWGEHPVANESDWTTFSQSMVNYDITRLKPNTQYDVQVTAVTGMEDQWVTAMNSPIRTAQLTLTVGDAGANEPAGANDMPIMANYMVNLGGGTRSTAIMATLTPTVQTPESASSADFTANPIPIEISAGEASDTVQIPITNDGIVEVNETFDLVLSGVTSGVNPAGSPAEFTITDQDTAQVTVSRIGAGAISEVGNVAARTVTFEIATSARVDADVMVPWSIMTNSNITASDFMGLISGDATITRNTDNTTASVVVANDAAREPMETFTFTLGEPSVTLAGRTDTPVTRGSPQSVNVDIMESDQLAPMVRNVTATAGTNIPLSGSNPNDCSDGTSTDRWDRDRKICVNWDAPTGGPSPTGYEVRYRTPPNTGEWSAPVIKGPNALNHVFSTGINPVTSYEVDVTSVITGYEPNRTTATATTASAITVNLGLSTATPSEGGSTTVSFSLSSPRSTDVQVAWSTEVGTATGGTGSPSDYESIAGNSITIPAGDLTGETTEAIDIYPDDVVEANETFTVGIDSPSGNVQSGADRDVTITDDDTVELGFNLSTNTLNEEVSGSDQAIITVGFRAAKTVANNVTVPIEVTGDTDDYTLVDQSVTILAGETSKQTTISIKNDDIVEAIEVLTIRLGDPTSGLAAGKVTSSDRTDVISIVDNDRAGISLTVNPEMVTEDVGSGDLNTVTFTATLDSVVTSGVQVDWTLTGTATTDDYTGEGDSTGVFTFPANSMENISRDLELTITNDDEAEDAEGITLTLSNPRTINTLIGNSDPISLTPPASRTATISSSDPVVGSATNVVVEAGNGSAQDQDRSINVTWSAPPGVMNVTGYMVQYGEERSGGGAPTEDSWIDGDMFGADDTLSSTIFGLSAETTYHVRILTMATQQSPMPTDGTHSVTTTPAITLTFEETMVTVQEGTDPTATLTPELSGARSVLVTARIATMDGTATGADGDFMAASQDVTFMVGSTTSTPSSVNVTVTDDEVVEGPEQFTATITVLAGDVGNGEATISIPANDTANLDIEMIENPGLTENDDTDNVATVTVTLDADVDAEVVVPLIVSNSEDVTLSSPSITLPAGTRTGTATITVGNDEVVEGEETFTVRMGDDMGTLNDRVTTDTSTTRTITIADDDTARLFISIDETARNEGEMSTVTVNLDAEVVADVVVPLVVQNREDVTLSTDSITLTAGARMGTATITVNDDEIVEGEETVTVRMEDDMGTLSDRVTADTSTIRTITITDDDFATLTITVDEDARAEGEMSTVTVTLNKQVAAEIEVPVVMVADGDPLTNDAEDTDYTISNSPITFMANGMDAAARTDSSVTVLIADDTVVEPEENLTLGFGTLVSDLADRITFTDTAEITITDTDTADVIVTADRTEVVEDVFGETENTVTFTISLVARSTADSTASTTDPVTVESPVGVMWSISGTGLSAGTDYSDAISGTETIPANTSSITVEKTILDDDDIEGNEELTFVVEFQSAVELNRPDGTVDVGTPGEVMVTIARSDTLAPPPTDIVLAAGNVDEYDADRSVYLTWEPPMASTGVTPTGYKIQYRTPPDTGTWTAVDDYETDATARNHTITGLDAGTAYEVQITTVAVNYIDSWTSATPAMVSTEAAITASITTTAMPFDEGSDLTVNLELSGERSVEVVVPIMIIPGTVFEAADLTETMYAATFAVGTTTASVTITAEDDDTVETNESFTISLGDETAGGPIVTDTGAVVLTISDNDTSEVSVAVAAEQEMVEEGATGEDGPDVAFTITLSKPVVSAVMVDWAITGVDPADYTVTDTSPATIAAGMTTATVTVSIENDTVTEDAETLTMTLSNVQVTVAGRTNPVVLATTPTEDVIIDSSDQPAPQPTNVAITAGIEGDTSSDPRQDEDRSFTASWDAPTGADVPAVTGYSVRYGVDPDEGTEPASWTTVEDLAADVTSLEVTTGITADTAYRVQVTSKTAESADNFTASAEGRTATAITATIGDGMADEGSSASLTVTLSGARSEEVVIPVTPGRNATADDTYDDAVTADFNPAVVTATIPAGDLSVDIEFPTLNDMIVEARETYVATLGAATSGVVMVSTEPGVVSINDSDMAEVTVEVSLTTDMDSDTEIDEGDTLTYTFTLDEIVTHEVTVDWDIAGTNVTAGDFDTVPAGEDQVVTFPAGGGVTSTQTVEVLVVDDSVTEQAEMFTLTMSNPTADLPGRTDEAITLETDPTETVTVSLNDQSLAPLATIGMATAGAAGPTATDTRRDLDRAATVTWTAPAPVAGVTVTGYGFRFAVDPDPDGSLDMDPAADAWEDGGSTDGIPSPLSFVVEGMDAETDYVIQVSAKAEGLGDNWSDSVKVETGTAVTSSITSDAEVTIAEGGDTTVTVELSGPRLAEVTIPFTLTGVDETADFEPDGPFEVVIGTGETSGTVTFTTDDDDLVEANEVMVATLGSASEDDGDVEPAATMNSVSVTITDNDTAVLSLAADVNARAEGEEVTLTLTLSNTASVDVSVPWAVTGASASDYGLADTEDPPTPIAVGDPIVIEAGTTTKTLTLTVTDDTEMEAEESLVFTLSTPTYTLEGRTGVITLETTPSETITIAANDEPTTEPTNFGLEGGVEGDMSTDPRRDADRSITVSWDVVAQTGGEEISGYAIRYVENPADDMDPDDDVWEETVIVELDEDDMVDDNLEYVLTGLEASTTYRVSITTRAEGLGDSWVTSLTQATAAEITASLSFGAPNTAVVGEDGDVVVSLSLTAPRSELVTFPLVYAGDVVDADFSAARPASVDIPVGVTSVDITFAVIDDELVEGNESLDVSLGDSTTGDVLVMGRLVSATINDNDTAVLSLGVDMATADEGDTRVFTFTLDKMVAVDVSVDWAVTGTAITASDYDAEPSPFTIPAGSLTADLSFGITDDLVMEAEETLTFMISNPMAILPGERTGVITLEAAPTETVVIAASDATQISGAPTEVQLVTGMAGPMTGDFRRDSDRSLTVTWVAPAGLAPPTLTGYAFRYAVDPDPDNDPGTPPADDAWVDGGSTTETTTLSYVVEGLSAETDYVVQVSGRADNQSANWSDGVKGSTGAAITLGFVSTSLSINEGETGTAMVALSGPRSETVTVEVDSAEGSADSADFTAIDETLTFAAGDVSKIVDVVTTEDTANEGNEQLTLVLSGETGEVTLGEGVLTVTITNDDAPVVTPGPIGPGPGPGPVGPGPAPSDGGDGEPTDTPSFTDSQGNTHEANIGQLAALGITRGCNPPANTRFCPDRAVTRAEMATFMVRAFNYDPFAQNLFTDDNGNVHESNINSLANAGVTRGCNPPTNDRFCPDRAVTRAEMATFLVRALELGAGDANFGDTSGSVHESNISSLAAAAITRGCNPPTNDRFCPDRAVTRAEMATFMVRAIAIAEGS